MSKGGFLWSSPLDILVEMVIISPSTFILKAPLLKQVDVVERVWRLLLHNTKSGQSMNGAPWSCTCSVPGHPVSCATLQGNAVFVFMSAMLGMQSVPDKSLLN